MGKSLARYLTLEDQIKPLEKVELGMIRAEHQKKFQVMIDYLKEKVGAGIEYKNSVVRVVVSENGAYYELNDLPEEFAGAAGDVVERHFLSPREALTLLTRAVAAVALATSENTRHVSILALYTRRGLVDKKNCYVYEYHPVDENAARAPLEIGQFQPDVIPLFFKIKIDADFAREALQFVRGMVFCMANAGDRHLLIRIPYEGEQITDLTYQWDENKTIH